MENTFFMAKNKHQMHFSKDLILTKANSLLDSGVSQLFLFKN